MKPGRPSRRFTQVLPEYRASRRNAFTIVEMLITIGAVGIITLGLAKLFSATSDTVRIGRRVSAMNDYAANIERTLRADISKMTRKGYLLIRHREVGDAKNVSTSHPAGVILLSPDDNVYTARRRRVDELMFFEEGSFTSARAPFNGGRTATGAAARIYYGHGLSGFFPPVPPSSDLSNYEVDIGDLKFLNDANGTAYNQYRPTFGLANPTPAQTEYPNRYASNWILLRHVTVLAPPQPTSSPNAPTGSGITFPDSGTWADSQVQVGLQPAAPDIFRAIVTKYASRNTPPSSPPARSSAGSDESALLTPMFSSGAVDVAATDLSAIRSRVLNAPKLAGLTYPFPLQLAQEGGSTSNYLGPYFSISSDPSGLSSSSSPYLMKQWMIQGLPNGPLPGTEGVGEMNLPERRIHCELSPPDVMGTVAQTSGFPYTDVQSFKRTDQMMLSASNFVPGCTEFIVEWSFGDIYPSSPVTDPYRAGKIVWHGMDRAADVTGLGQMQVVADMYRDSSQTRVTQLYAGTDGSLWRRGPVSVAAGNGLSLNNPIIPWTPASLGKPIFRSLIHFPVTDGSATPPPVPNFVADQLSPVYSCFGYLDPMFQPQANSNDPATVPWPWPKLLRITIGLVDPSVPTQEFRYQFIFDIPSGNNS